MSLEFLFKRFAESPQGEAIIWKGESFTYGWLQEKTNSWVKILNHESIKSGTVTAIIGDFSPNFAALLLALIYKKCIITPLSKQNDEQLKEYCKIAQCEVLMYLSDQDESNFKIEKTKITATHELILALKKRSHSGLILFSSGSTGKSKAIIHHFDLLLDKFRERRKTMRTLFFLLHDHIGGINTLFYVFSNLGCLVITKNRSPEAILKIIEDCKVELLPTSPTFLNLMLMSEAYKRFSLSSLKLITYGTEPMLESTLKKLHQLFPSIGLRQSYGLTEVGILGSKIMSADSLWVKLGGHGFETRVVNDMLQIKSPSPMLGYLNAPSPFTEDGWLITGDKVEVKGDFFKILGRESDLINVGGEKVYPSQVESICQEIEPNIHQIAIYGEKNLILGNIVCAKIVLKKKEDPKIFTARFKKACRSRMKEYMMPIKISFESNDLHSERYKKIRRFS